MWKGFESHYIWERAAKILAAIIVIAVWVLLAWSMSDWITTAFKGMFL